MRQIFLLYPNKTQRLLEIIVPSMSWLLVTMPLWLSFWHPAIVAYFIITFDVYWFYKSFTLAFYAIRSYLTMTAHIKVDWLTQAKSLSGFKTLHHVIIIPQFREPIHILRRTFTNLTKQEYPKEKLIVVLATEEKDLQSRVTGQLIQKEFGHLFGHFLTTRHALHHGEVAGKSSNMAWAAKKVVRKLSAWRIQTTQCTITSCDADTLLHPKYLASLAYHYLKDPDRSFHFYQGAVLFYSNIWRVPAPIRMMNSLGSIVHTSQNSRTDKLVNFSCYSLSMKLLDDVGYWDVDVIPEDYRLFFKAYFKCEGKVEVDPVFLPVISDAAESTSYIKSLVNFYEQEKRWAWGVSDDSYFIKNWITHTEIPFWQRTIRVFRVIADHFLWPVNWFIITLGANIPVLINPVFAQTVMGQNLPKISFGILTSCWLFLAVIIVLDMRQRPKRQDATLFKKLILPLEYLMMPVVTFIFTALPGIDAHTRLMLGKYLEYRVTEKV